VDYSSPAGPARSPEDRSVVPIDQEHPVEYTPSTIEKSSPGYSSVDPLSASSPEFGIKSLPDMSNTAFFDDTVYIPPNTNEEAIQQTKAARRSMVGSEEPAHIEPPTFDLTSGETATDDLGYDAMMYSEQVNSELDEGREETLRLTSLDAVTGIPPPPAEEVSPIEETTPNTSIGSTDDITALPGDSHSASSSPLATATSATSWQIHSTSSVGSTDMTHISDTAAGK